jgi:predicted RNA binding protein YcfA (HicA-like mRNA interferase family)
MGKLEKRIARLRQNPRNVRFEELEGILLGLGFTERMGKGSHVSFSLEGNVLIIPKQKPQLREVYIKLVLEKLDEMGMLPKDEGE